MLQTLRKLSEIFSKMNAALFKKCHVKELAFRLPMQWDFSIFNITRHTVCLIELHMGNCTKAEGQSKHKQSWLLN